MHKWLDVFREFNQQGWNTDTKFELALRFIENEAQAGEIPTIESMRAFLNDVADVENNWES